MIPTAPELLRLVAEEARKRKGCIETWPVEITTQDIRIVLARLEPAADGGATAPTPTTAPAWEPSSTAVEQLASDIWMLNRCGEDKSWSEMSPEWRSVRCKSAVWMMKRFMPDALASAKRQAYEECVAIAEEEALKGMANRAHVIARRITALIAALPKEPA